MTLVAALLIAHLPASAGPTVKVGTPMRQLALPLSDAAIEALRTQSWEEAQAALREMDASALAKGQRADWSFLVAWTAARAGAPDGAIDMLPGLSEIGPTVPESYFWVAKGEVLQAAGQSAEALDAFAAVDRESALYATAALAAADALRALEREGEAWERVGTVLERPDPTRGNEEVLLAVAEHHGAGSAEALPLLERLWTFYPDSEEAGRASTMLEVHDYTPTWEVAAQRAERWMFAEKYDTAVRELEPLLEHASEPSIDGCRLRYTLGRSHYKRNRLRASVEAFGDIGAQCAEAEGSYGQRGLYLLGTAQYRRKEFDASAEAYKQLAELYPTSSMADDALTRGGISLLEGEREEEAREWWARALKDHPEGDTVPEAALRLAFARYDQGNPKEAIEIAEELTELPLGGNAVHIEAGRYWSARWRYYPDADSPRTASSNKKSQRQAIDGWRALCEDSPHSFYAILAYSRLVEVAPKVAQGLERGENHTDGSEVVPWEVRLDTLKDTAFRDAVGLVRLGLVQEARQSWRQSNPSEWTADEKAWTIELRGAAGDWLLAHDDLRRWIIAHPLSTLGPREAQIIRLAWPDRYWDEVQASVAADYGYEPRLFHGLVREESNFNRHIISFAGARGLSQLMWRTAQQTAGWLKVSVTKDELFEPEKNLQIGARYLGAMHKQLGMSPFLALAAYNGGARNVKRWVEEHDNPPLDEWVERIPFRETRGYVKRVMGTWQTMRYHFDRAAAPFPDLSTFNHRALP